MRPLSLPSLFLALLLPACGGGSVHLLGDVSKSLEIDAAPTLANIHVPAGAVRVEAAAPAAANAKPRVEVEAQVSVVESRLLEFQGLPLKFEDHVELEMAADGTLTVQSAHANAPDRNDWRLRLLVRVPGAPAVTAHCGAGQVRVELPSAQSVNANTGAGEVVVAAGTVADAVVAESGAGRVHVTVRDAVPAQGIRADCAAGEVRITLPQVADVNAKLDLESSVGNVRVHDRFAAEVKRATVGASCRATLGQGGPTIRGRSAAGEVRVE